jgi:hypothetical protein
VLLLYPFARRLAFGVQGLGVTISMLALAVLMLLH